MRDPQHPVWGAIRLLAFVALFGCGAFVFADSPDMTEVKLGIWTVALKVMGDKIWPKGGKADD